MADTEEVALPVIAVTAAVGAVVLLFVLLCGVGKKIEDSKKAKEEEEEKAKSSNGTNGNQAKKQNAASKKVKPERRGKEKKHQFTHPWLASILKGHSGYVLDMDFSLNGKYLATAADDRTLWIWNTKDFANKEHKCVRVNVEFDHATKVKFSPDNRALVINLYNENAIRVIKVSKKDDGSLGSVQGSIDFRKAHEAEIIDVGISSNGKFIMTASSDTQIKVYNLKGESLASIDTHQISTNHVAVSPCGRFIGASGFTSDVKIYEVCFDKTGHYHKVERAFELKGHKAGVYGLAFSQGSTRMATISKDGTWKLWDTDIEYTKGQEPYLLQTGQVKETGQSLISLSPDGRTVVIATGSNLYIFKASSGECVKEIYDIFAGPVTAVGFDLSCQYILCSGDKQVCVFYNIVGYQATILDLEEKRRKNNNNAHRERLQKQIDEARSLLKKVQVEHS